MKRYTFRLAAVLRARRNEQDVAQSAVLRARAVAAERAAVLAERERAYAAGVDAQGLRSSADFVHEQAHRAALAQAVLDARRNLQTAEDDIEAARVIWTTAATRVGALERLDERGRAEHSALLLREEDLVVDDLVVSRAGSER